MMTHKPCAPWKIRNWAITAALLAVLIAVPAAVAALSASPAPDHIALTWVQDARTTQTVTWRTQEETIAGQVRFFETGKQPPINPAYQMAAAEAVPMVTQEGVLQIHSATLTGLKPGTSYAYQVGNGNIWSDMNTFTTAAAQAGEFEFLVFGDSQSTDYNVWRATLQAAFQSVPAAVFFTNVGDLVDVGQDYGEWEAWFAGAAGVIEKIPVMPATGNHETYTPERRFSMPVFFTAQFRLPSNGPEELKGQVYSFDYGDVHFIMLDSQEGEEKRYVPDLLDIQKNWLEKDLAATDRTWKIIFIHRPLYGNKPNGANENLRRAFAGVFAQYGVDVVFTAHDHVYARTWPLTADGAAASPGQGTVFVATGRSGTKAYGNVESKEWNEVFRNPTEEPNYLTVKVLGDSLRIQARTQGGEMIDEWSIDKMIVKKEKS